MKILAWRKDEKKEAKKAATKYRFVPKEDITAYELAVIVANIGYGMSQPIGREGMHADDEEWSSVPDNIKRHFFATP